ncbi:MAG TPA: ATP-binding protein, partial [Urbifossiella sp.]
MRFIIAPEFYQQMLQVPYHTPDCYVRPGEYLHHMYIDGVKYTIAPAVVDCLAQAEKNEDHEAISHLQLHQLHYNSLLADAQRVGDLEGVTLIGDPPPTDEE